MKRLEFVQKTFKHVLKLNLVITAVFLASAVFLYMHLSTTIPVHISFLWNIDGFGNKGNVFFFPAVNLGYGMLCQEKWINVKYPYPLAANYLIKLMFLLSLALLWLGGGYFFFLYFRLI